MPGIKHSPGCLCCGEGGDPPPPPPPPPSPCCNNCSDGGGYFNDDMDVTISGFGDSSDCGTCDFINGTFTLQCAGGLPFCAGITADYPVSYIPGDTCYWSIEFSGYPGDRECSFLFTDEHGNIKSSSMIWTGLVLMKFRILTGVDDYSDHWRLFFGYSMEAGCYHVVLDDEGNPVNRGNINTNCTGLNYKYIPTGSLTACGLTGSESFTLNDTPDDVTVNCPEAGETHTVAFTDFCSSTGTVEVEAA